MAQLQASANDIFAVKYADSIFELAAQTSARTRPAVELVQMDTESMMLPRAGNVEAQSMSEKFPEAVPQDLQWDSRRLTTDRVGVVFFIDEWDKMRMMGDPQNVLARRAAQALERKFDRIVIASLTAPAWTGKLGNVPITAAVDGVVNVSAIGGFTYDTLLQINQNYKSVEIGTESPVRKFLFLSEQEEAKLMREGMLTSRDFTDRMVVDKGRLTNVLDFEVIVFGSGINFPMLPVANNQRTCFAVASGGIKVGISRTWRPEFKDRNDRIDTDQLITTGILGAARMEAVRIQTITTTVGQ